MFISDYLLLFNSMMIIPQNLALVKYVQRSIDKFLTIFPFVHK